MHLVCIKEGLWWLSCLLVTIVSYLPHLIQKEVLNIFVGSWVTPVNSIFYSLPRNHFKGLTLNVLMHYLSARMWWNMQKEIVKHQILWDRNIAFVSILSSSELFTTYFPQFPSVFSPIFESRPNYLPFDWFRRIGNWGEHWVNFQRNIS